PIAPAPRFGFPIPADPLQAWIPEAVRAGFPSRAPDCRDDRRGPGMIRAQLPLLGLLLFLPGRRIVRLTPLHVAALLDEVAHLVGRHGQLALRTDIQGRSDQEVVAPPHPLRRSRFTPFWYSHESPLPGRSGCLDLEGKVQLSEFAVAIQERL